MKQEILHYERQILTNSQIRDLELPTMPSIFTFEEWNLSASINAVMAETKTEISMKWIGNSQYSESLAYYYSIFRLCMLHP